MKLGTVENVSVNYAEDKLPLRRSRDFLSVAEAEVKMSALVVCIRYSRTDLELVHSILLLDLSEALQLRNVRN